MAVYAARSGCESVTKLPPTILTYSIVSAPGPQIQLPVYFLCTSTVPWFLDIAFPTICLIYGTKPLLSFILEASALTIPQTFWPSQSSSILWYGLI